MKVFRWRGWDEELTPRARGLLLGASLLGLTALSTRHLSLAVSSRPTIQLSGMFTDSTRPRVDSMTPRRRDYSRRSSSLPAIYRRSAQVLQAEIELQQRNLILPLQDITIDQLRDSFDNLREAGSRMHNAVDLPAPVGTPVVSVDSGTVIRMATSDDAGISLYATDPSRRYTYFYAHLDSYHPLISEGATIVPGDTLGFVGTTGNAKPNGPHLHFAIHRASSLGLIRGTPINPVRIWRK